MVVDSLTKAHSIYSKDYKTILVSVSGGSDSDILVDICHRMDPESKRTKYVWVNTGLEYRATIEHLEYLEKRYGIQIIRQRAKTPIPVSVRKYGQPFLSKTVSEFMYRLQLHNFQWEDEPYEELIKKYPRCKSALEWWCNEKGENSKLNISNNRYLKEFIMANPPTFAISNKCCEKTKKESIAQVIKSTHADLDITGVRKYEGGARGNLKGCFSPKSKKSKCDTYMPLFWYKNEDKEAYARWYGIANSKCYTDYGLKRTGCCGCPCARNFEEELATCEKFEPNLAKACNYIFKDSYAYGRAYRDFVQEQKRKENSHASTDTAGNHRVEKEVSAGNTDSAHCDETRD